MESQTQGGAFPSGLTTLCTPLMKSITVLLYRKLFRTWMFFFCRRQQNKFPYRKFNFESALEKKLFWTHFRLSGVVDQATACCLPLHYICLIYI